MQFHHSLLSRVAALCLACYMLFSTVVFAKKASSSVVVCPGEGPRYGDFKCNHDGTHRVCAKLLNEEGQPLSWGKGDFWAITGQKRFQWDDKIRAKPNPGDSWCICMWAMARMIQSAGCDNVHIHCNATDIDFVMNSYNDGGTKLDGAHKCLQQKCFDNTDDSSSAAAAPASIETASDKTEL